MCLPTSTDEFSLYSEIFPNGFQTQEMPRRGPQASGLSTELPYLDKVIRVALQNIFILQFDVEV